MAQKICLEGLEVTPRIALSLLCKKKNIVKRRSNEETKSQFISTYSILQDAFIKANFELISLFGCSMLFLIFYLLFHVDSDKNDERH